jgi:hypothetical protein
MPSMACALRACPRQFTKLEGTILNSFSWPAQQVSYKDVAHKIVPDDFVAALHPGYNLKIKNFLSQ